MESVRLEVASRSPSSTSDLRSGPDEDLSYAKVLVELGEVDQAERWLSCLLEQRPEDLDVLSLYTKVLHIRGKLSQALACWAQIHARSPHNENALMYLAAVLSFARDPERGAGEFVSLGQLQLAKKPLAQVELEEAFVLFLQRRPVEARAACDAIARRSGARDLEQYKLAMLAKAWVSEMSGELDVARETLEELGRQRGLETDTDRVLSLVRVCTRIGTPEALQAAAHICRFLERSFEKLSVVGKMAAIYSRLGQTDRAAEYAARYLAHFRRRMHLPSLAEIVVTAANHYFPLERLSRIRIYNRILPEQPSRRARAVAAALAGSAEAARKGFQGGGESIDLKYLGDLAEREGDADEAVRLRVQAAAIDPDEVILGQLLGASDHNHDAASFLRAGDTAERARCVLESAVRESPLRSDLWRGLGILAGLLGERDEKTRLLARADALAEAARRDREPIGRALAAAVYHFMGKAKGLIHQVWAGRRPAEPGMGGNLVSEDILGNLTPEMTRAVRNTFLSVREYARSKFPHRCLDIMDWSYTYKVTKEDEPSGGLSAGLPSALAFLSVVLQRPVSQELASSGLLVADSHDVLMIRQVGDAPQKVKAAYHRNLRALLLPRDNREDLKRGEHVPVEIGEEIVRYVSDLDEAVTLAFGEEIWTA